MARSRSILIDNSLGRVFSGVAKTSDAQNSNVIGGSVPQVKSITAASKTAVVANTFNIAAKVTGLSLGANGGQVTTTKVVMAKAHEVGTLNVIVKVGATYATSVEVVTIALATRTLSASSNTVFVIPAGQTIFIDTQYVGVPTKKATGLTVSFNHYPTPA